MRDYAKVGGRAGKPGYRTPAAYLHRKVKELLVGYVKNFKKRISGKR